MNILKKVARWYFEEAKNNSSQIFCVWESYSGRVGPKDFGLFVLCNHLIGVLATVALGFIMQAEILELTYKTEVLLSVFIGIWTYITITLFGACIRRLHDAGCSGFWVLLLPLSSLLFVFIIFSLGTQPGKNKYDNGVNKSISEKPFSSKGDFNAVTAAK